MFSTIVVGTDGSDTARQAVDLAIDLARSSGATLHMVTVFRTASAGVAVAAAGAAAGASDAAAHALSREVGQQILEEAAARAGELKVERHVVAGAPADGIIQVATEVGADLIVVGSKGMQGARRILGSVPNSVAHGAPCNVLVAKTS